MSGHIDDLYEGLPSSVLGVPVYPAYKWPVQQGWVAVNALRGTGIVVAARWGAQTLRYVRATHLERGDKPRCTTHYVAGSTLPTQLAGNGGAEGRIFPGSPHLIGRRVGRTPYITEYAQQAISFLLQ
ncbi:hypothetical protein IPF89_01630 [Candidatus Saccharibacteria bacterium]|nr:MAG: hypothetical protein IPF89_01630 [Candidatus Saccharibacteria bacterium]